MTQCIPVHVEMAGLVNPLCGLSTVFEGCFYERIIVTFPLTLTYTRVRARIELLTHQMGKNETPN